MYTLDFIKKHITDLLNQILEGVEVDVKDLTYPPNSEYGDLSLPCFGLAQTLKMSPGEIADFLVGKIKSDDIISGITTAGPYANFFINKKYLAKNVIEEIKNKNENYGANNQGEGYKIIIEYSNANTHKEYHIGHLRNISYGDAINRILANNGYTTIPVSYINDFGIHVAKTLWNYHDYVKNNYKSEENLEKMPAQEKGASLGKMYADATTKEKDSPIAKQMINRMMKKITSKQGEEYKLWKKTRQWNIKQFENIYQELGVKILQKKYSVAMTGDGVNDALALKKSDVGIAMGQKGTDTSKEASDIILLDDNFATIRDAIKEGRRIFDNIRKFLNYLLTSNFAEVLVIFVATIFITLEEPILLPAHLLWINLLTDGFPALALGKDPAKKDIMKRKPRQKGEPLVNKKLLWLIGTIGFLLTFVLLAVFISIYELKEFEAARSALFTGFILFECVRIGSIRAREGISWFSNWWLIGAMGLTILLQLIVVYTPLNKVFEIQPLGIIEWLILVIGLIISYFGAIFITKGVIKWVK